MKGNPEERAIAVAEYIIDSGDTVRGAAARFGVSKSTVHKDLTQRLPYINRSLYTQAAKVLGYNKSQRHIRGGLATREKYAALK
ncbi:sporulation transcriptional regulator SpoIIID [Ruminococcaceae bacterium OttesenSCG-928-N02]|nr:sporulation transcriptional regulator SpoIIID [Ruminococcaceae bacterium OttesenSCG-928-N02]